MSTPIKTVALYARVSTKDKQETENQLTQLRQFCARQGWTIVHEYVDKVSGKRSDNRPSFQAMMGAASHREFDLLLFWSLDRLSREGVLPTLRHLEQLTSYGVAWKSYTEQYFDSCGEFRDAVISIAATLAKQERVRISERTIAGLQTARRHGVTLGRPKLVVDRQRVQTLSQAGMTTREIAAQVGCSAASVCRLLA